MESQNIKEIIDGLTRRGVVSADTRRQVFAILNQQAKEHNQKISLIEDDLKRVRASRDALVKKNEQLLALVPKSKLAQLDG